MRPRLIVLLTVALLLTACLQNPLAVSGMSAEVGARGPEFTLEQLGGNAISLSALQGQVVLINYWATWCGPCRLEMPIIQARYNDGGFAVLAVNFDESAERVQRFVDELGLDFPVLLDPGGRVQELYRVRGYPTSYFLDSEGIIRFIHIGEMSATDLDRYLTQLEINS